MGFSPKQEEICRIVQLINDGLSFREVARRLQRSPNTIIKYYFEYRNRSAFTNR